MSATIFIGDCCETLKSLADASVDSVVCDPPYHLTSIVKRFGAANAAPAKVGKTGAYARASKGFMGQTWDGGDVAFQPETWAEVLRVLKPGGHMVAFSGTRTYHRMVCAIEDAGFEIRDMLSWIFGSGFPKSHNFEGGLGTALKPAHEPICLARKPLAGTVAGNVQAHGTGALNIDGCRIGHASDDDLAASQAKNPGRSDSVTSAVYGAARPQQSVNAAGRWPANLCHDGSEEVLAGFPETSSGELSPHHKSGEQVNTYGKSNGAPPSREFGGDSGSAARFFYCAKATTAERGEGNNHPTVKPVALMQWLCRLVTPKGGTVLDPFMGSGSTGLAADAEQFSFIGCELSPEYAAVAEQRMRDAAGMFADVQVAA